MAQNLSTIIDDLRAKREKISELNKKWEAAVAPFKEEEEQLELQLIAALDEQKTTGARNKHFAASIQESPLPKIDDFDKFAQFIIRFKAVHLLERRVSRNAFKELLESRKGKPVPGVSVFVKRTIRLDKLGD